MIQLRTLGVLDLRGSDGRALRSILAQPKRLALLSYLAVTGLNEFLRRDQVLALFWPEQDDEHARAALNRALYYLRHSLGDGTLLSRGDDEIGLSGGVFWCDAAALVTAVAEGRHRDAVELYRGDLLEGFHISDAPGFERWVDVERNRLRELALRAAWALAEESESAGNHALAAHWARWIAERSPYDEAAVQHLMTFLDRAGDRAGALHAFEQFTRRIGADLELSPSPETRALAKAIRSREEPANAPGVLAGPGEPTLVPGNAPGHAFPRVERPTESAAVLEPGVEAAAVPALPDLEPKARSRPWPRARFAGAAAAVTLLSAATILLLVASRRPALDPQLIVVAPLRNLTGDPSLDALAATATEWTTQSIADFVETTTSPALTDKRRVERASGGASDGRRAAQKMHAGTAVSGAIYRDRGELRFHARVDVLTEGIAWSIRPVSVPADSLERAIREVRDRVTGAVGVLVNACLAPWLRLGTEPPTFEAYAEFGRGNYRRAAQLDTTFTWAVLYAMTVDMQLADKDAVSHRIAYDRRVKGDSIAGAMQRMRGRLAPLQRHWLDWRLASRTGDLLGGYRAMQEADKLAPGVFAWSFAQRAHQLYRPRESLKLLERYSPGSSCLTTPADAAHDVREQRFVMAQLHHELREHERELEVVHLTRDQADGLDALWHEVRARAALGQTSHVLALLDTALSYPRIEVYPAGALMLTAAEEFRAHGHAEAFTEALARAIDWYGSRPGDEASELRFNLAAPMYLAGRWNEADSLFRKIAAVWPEQTAEVEGYLGAIAARRGDRAGAERILQELERLTQSTERPIGEVFYAQARIRALLGDREGAVSSLRDWIGGQGSDLVHTEIDFESLADYRPFRDFIRPKG